MKNNFSHKNILYHHKKSNQLYHNRFLLHGKAMRNKVSELIGLVSMNEVNQGIPMMSAIVVSGKGKTGKELYE